MKRLSVDERKETFFARPQDRPLGRDYLGYIALGSGEESISSFRFQYLFHRDQEKLPGIIVIVNRHWSFLEFFTHFLVIPSLDLVEQHLNAKLMRTVPPRVTNLSQFAQDFTCFKNEGNSSISNKPAWLVTLILLHNFAHSINWELFYPK